MLEVEWGHLDLLTKPLELEWRHPYLFSYLEAENGGLSSIYDMQYSCTLHKNMAPTMRSFHFVLKVQLASGSSRCA